MPQLDGPTVQQVNQPLNAADDPWGGGSWWATRNAWLDAVPLDLLGSEREPRILVAASEQIAEVW